MGLTELREKEENLEQTVEMELKEYKESQENKVFKDYLELQGRKVV